MSRSFYLPYPCSPVFPKGQTRFRHLFLFSVLSNRERPL